jgi:hypothetical protein
MKLPLSFKILRHLFRIESDRSPKVAEEVNQYDIRQTVHETLTGSKRGPNAVPNTPPNPESGPNMDQPE